MLNRVILIGRPTKDPELRYTPAGVAVAQMTLAVDRPHTSGRGRGKLTSFRLLSGDSLLKPSPTIFVKVGSVL